jgi:hypothetical protein
MEAYEMSDEAKPSGTMTMEASADGETWHPVRLATIADQHRRMREALHEAIGWIEESPGGQDVRVTLAALLAEIDGATCADCGAPTTAHRDACPRILDRGPADDPKAIEQAERRERAKLDGAKPWRWPRPRRC